MPTYPTPRMAADATEGRRPTPTDGHEHFAGYGVLGLPFESGHVLGLRRFPASSIGPGFTAIWHRSPDGSWRFWSTTAPALSCARYTGEISDNSQETDIELDWLGPFHLKVTCADPAIEWEITLRSSLTTRMLTTVAQRFGNQFVAHDALLRLVGPASGLALRSGRLCLVGTMPNGQGYRLVPTQVWAMASSQATVEGVDVGRPAPLTQQATIGDFRIPQRGLLATGELAFDALDPTVHSTRIHRSMPARS